MTINSNPDTIARNSGIFWALLQCSLLFGNLFVYFEFQGETRVTQSTRLVVYIALASVGAIGTLLLFVLQVPSEQPACAESQGQASNSESVVEESKNASVKEIFCKLTHSNSHCFFHYKFYETKRILCLHKSIRTQIIAFQYIYSV